MMLPKRFEYFSKRLLKRKRTHQQGKVIKQKRIEMHIKKCNICLKFSEYSLITG